MKDRFQAERYRPVSIRRRLLIVLLALATAASVLLYMLGRRGQIVREGPPVAADVAACKNGNTLNCVGGMATVIIASPSMPAPAAAASQPP